MVSDLMINQPISISLLAQAHGEFIQFWHIVNSFPSINSKFIDLMLTIRYVMEISQWIYPDLMDIIVDESPFM